MTTAAAIKTAFAASGIKVRVKACRFSFRVCTLDESAHTEASLELARSLGLRPFINQAHEMFAHV